MRFFKYFLLGFALIWLAACQQNTTNTTPPSDQTAAIESILADSTDLFYDALDDSDDSNITTEGANWLGGSTTLAKTSRFKLHYGRIRTKPVERSIQVTLDTDSTATAYVYTKFIGKFVVFKARMDSNSFSFDRYAKPLEHEVERIVHLRKFRNTDVPRKNWKITDVSLKYGASPNHTVEIVELDIMPAGYDTVAITDPLAYFERGSNMFNYSRWTDIRLRVKVRNTTANPVIFPENTQATEMVRLVYGRNHRGNFGRNYFEWKGQDGQGNNIYEGNWTIKQLPGIHHAVIDVVDNGTILNPDAETYPYNSTTWSTPYRVTVF